MMFAELRFLGALDYSKAYDHMRPEITAKVMREARVPEDLVDLFEVVWSDQVRYVTFAGHWKEAQHTRRAARGARQ